MSEPSPKITASFHCQLCTEEDNDYMVQCDTCDEWYHYTCVGVSDDIANHDWACSTCRVFTPERSLEKDVEPTSSHSQAISSVSQVTSVQAIPGPIFSVQLPPPQSPNRTSHSSQVCIDIDTATGNTYFPPVSEHPLAPQTNYLSFSCAGTDSSAAGGMKNLSSAKPSRLYLGEALGPLSKHPDQVHFVSNNVVPPLQHQMQPSTQTRQSCDNRNDMQKVKNTSSAYRSLFLQRLKEERQLKAIRDKEYLDKKYEMLRDQDDRDADDDHDVTTLNAALENIPMPFRNKNPHPGQCTNATKTSSAFSQRGNFAPFENSTFNCNPNYTDHVTTMQHQTTNCSAPPPSKENLHESTTVPNQEQLAARQLMSREQVTFSGRIEEWPMFISWFNSSTSACGYTNIDNLRRLQNCLKDSAHDTVGVKLFFPEQVPGALRTLQMLYGRPEAIIDNLLEKIRREEPPQVERLETVIQFYLTVENTCAVMLATGLHDHLANPSLIRELSNRLPPQIRLNWGTYRRGLGSVDLKVFSDWLADVAHSASEVTPFNMSNSINLNGQNNSRRVKARLNAHEDYEPQSSLNARKCPLCQFGCKALDQCQTFLELNINERWDVVHRNFYCRLCLRQHGRNRCHLIKPCGVDGCAIKHHKLLHKTRKLQNSSDPEVQINCAHQFKRNSILFRIVPVTLYHNDNKIDTFAFLDDGSSISLMDEELSSKLGVTGEPQPLCLKWTSNTHRTESASMKVNLQISPTGSTKKYNIENVHTVKSLGLPKQSINMEQLATRYSHLIQIPIKSYVNAKPQILLGLDQWKLTIPLRSREGADDQPVASKTRLGWTVYGPYAPESHVNTRNEQQPYSYNFHVCNCRDQRTEDENLSKLFKEFIALESAGVKTKPVLLSVNEELALSTIQNNWTKEGRKYFVPLLWRTVDNHLPDSRKMAERRLASLERRMQKDEKLYENLNKQIEEYVKKQYARKLDEEELQQKNHPVWYLPIFPVVNHNKPDKTRMVWDAAAEVNGISLNSMLLSGPDIVPSLISILFQFRERKIAIVADIKEMFHQVGVKKSDQHAQRFLWRNKGTKLIEEFVMQVLTFGSTSSPFCAQFIKNLNAKHFAANYPRAAIAITEKHYVDDWLDSFDTEEEAIQVAHDVIKVHNEGNFEIRNFLSNSPAVLASLKDKAANYEKSINGWHPLSGPEKVLGMWWLPSADSFSYAIKASTVKIDILAKDSWPTKREVLKVLMSVFDPLGLIANFLVLLKILMQDIWASAIGWDEKIHPRHLEKWRKWLDYIPAVRNIVITRRYLKHLSFGGQRSVQMHIFVDASEVAYAALGYFRVTDGVVVESVLVAAKTKVAPLKVITIPKLELEAALLGIKLAKCIVDGHSIRIEERYFWSDSKTVLSWIHSDHRKYKQFVAFRVGAILEESEAKNWRWIPGNINVADEATKWQTKTEFKSNSRWFRGPRFLYDPPAEWPEEFKTTAPCTEEIRSVHLHHVESFEPLIDVSKYSKWIPLIRTLAQVFRFIRRTSKKRENGATARCLISIDFKAAENYLFKLSQRDSFPQEVAALKKNNPVDKSSILYKLSPYLDDNAVLRVKGRIDAAYGVSMSIKRPIILPRYHHITELIILAYHEKFFHQYDETVVNELRQKFFIPQLRVLLATIKREKCQFCRNRKCVPKTPIMGDLPSARLQPFTRPFSFIGIDYFGPIFVTVGRHSEKRWGVLITCLTIRAVHLEVAHTLSADSCIMALNRFVARRGWPLEIFSDNGTNFRGASNELLEAVRGIDITKMAEKFTHSNLKWQFIPPSAPHMGGSWERLVRSVKTTLSHIQPTRNPSDELLLTMMAEVERVINSRPLTYVPLGGLNEEALTPNHFLLGSSNGEKLAGELSDDGFTLRKNWHISEQFANRFWRRWVSEYLPDLTMRTKWYSPTKPIREGDIVIIVDPESPRNSWPKGIVLKTLPGKDGQVRSAVVKTLTGIYTRPAAKLAVLDVERFGDSGKTAQASVLPGGSVAKPGSTEQASGMDS